VAKSAGDTGWITALDASVSDSVLTMANPADSSSSSGLFTPSYSTGCWPIAEGPATIHRSPAAG
jgi:hypothetical protein